MQLDKAPRYTMYHFSLSLATGNDQADVPKLLEHLSKTIREYGDIVIHDIVFHGDTYVDNELHPQIVVYYSLKKSDQ